MAETDAPSPVDIHSRTKSLKYKFSCHHITVSVNGQSYVYLTCLPPEPAVLPSWRWVLAWVLQGEADALATKQGEKTWLENKFEYLCTRGFSVFVVQIGPIALRYTFILGDWSPPWDYRRDSISDYARVQGSLNVQGRNLRILRSNVHETKMQT